MIINPYTFGGGGAGASISLTDLTISRSLVNATATATFNVAINGNLTNHLGNVLGVWINDVSVVALYSVRATFVTGDAGQPTGTALGVWTACDVGSSWSVVAPMISSKTATILVEIRLTSSGVVKDSANITLNADASDTYTVSPGTGGGGGDGLANIDVNLPRNTMV